jgi:S-adenosyl-L-methionine hydrolase (adenosine-forming)
MAAARDRRRAAVAASGPARAPASRPPIITLTTDFGTRDPFVGVMKGVILGRVPDARIVDLTHAVPPQAVDAAAHVVRSAAPWFPSGTIHVAVVDPGVGTRRRALVVETTDACFVGPDNGVLSLAAPARAVRRIVDVSRSPVRLTPMSRTFHGRDLFAPVAAALALGIVAASLGKPAASMVRLRIQAARRTQGVVVGRVLWADGFGNLTTSITRQDLASFRGRRLSITIGPHVVPFRPSYASVPPGKPVALLNSCDLLEIAVNRGSAHDLLAIAPGTSVRIAHA